MKLPINSTAALAVIAIGVAIFELVRSHGSGNFRIPAIILIVIVLLLGFRYAMRRQARKRAERLNAVPKHPLGLSDEPPPEHRAENGHR
ncbi:MAG TPA: hypothetical protein VFW83_04320 [Bryobacteraceae bacterium]|nr:hypothetical protein [Bryobacteraceae bacterium]